MYINKVQSKFLELLRNLDEFQIINKSISLDPTVAC